MEYLSPVIYYEIFLPSTNKIEAMLQVRHSLAWRNFDGIGDVKDIEFQENSEGDVSWRRFFFQKITARYKVVSYQKNDHILMEITHSFCRSTVLLTAKEEDAGTILRLDHRSFTGPKFKSDYRFFNKFWKELFKELAKESQKHK